MKANVLKIKPPIIFNKENVDTLIENLKQVMDELASEWLWIIYKISVNNFNNIKQWLHEYCGEFIF